ncbi:SLC13 family permease [Desulfatitalea alkaliphila]|uniref:DASS family sodium-coupled anion symporter n=1 Tax=Desulfatitalea alkaliphila TaxID=2929485 RepID=A0AA41R3Y5_9BACT|nr:DASS family sodium-coupled anion symporter [Desulfatitalea alkaliphila]MCJ8498953.1 DASS family sodium-coupled anion symporter [Desulfatitalea alkaliphila]
MRSTLQKTGLFLGPILFLIVLAMDLDPERAVVTRMAAVAVLMATWWVTDAVPMSATALLPMVLYPLLGILKGSELAPVYINSTIFLFLGGFMIAVAMENWLLHRRIALKIIRIIGGGPARLVLGFMIAAGFLSMWISNTATAIMMLPIGMAIVSKLEADFGRERVHPFTVALMLGIAYACSTGGIATLVGTPPNLALQRIYELTFPEAAPIAFGQWFVMALPLSLVMGAIVWLLLTRVFFSFPKDLRVDRDVVEMEYRQLGRMSYEEKIVGAVFAATALLWIFRTPLNLGFVGIPGWSQLLPYPGMIDDGTVAVAMALILFIIPSRDKKSKRSAILGLNTVQRLPWNIVLLFGGGFALAEGFQVTGLADYLGAKMFVLQGIHPILLIAVICVGLTFLTELTSNTATTQMILPIVASVAVAMQIHPLLLMVPATIAASCAFMLPIATPPNAIVFGSGRIQIHEMARVGIFINLIGVPIITFFFYFIGRLVFDIDLGAMPQWAIDAAAGR